MYIFLTEDELERENNLFAPNNKEYKALGGIKIDLSAFLKQPEETDPTLNGKSDKAEKPAVFVPPSC